MPHPTLIIRLIQQDLKHNRLIGGLEKLGLDSDGKHYLDIMDMVFDLMRVPEHAGDRWCEMYVAFMEEAAEYEATDGSKALKGLARACYKWLRACKEFEDLR